MNQTCDLCGAPFGEDHRKGCPVAPMTDTPAPVAQPLSAEEESGVRQMLWEHRLAYANVPSEGVESWADIADRLLATLDAARSVPDNAAPPSDPVPLYLEGVVPRRTFNLRNEADFRWLADYFSGYHGVPGLRAAAVPDNAALREAAQRAGEAFGHFATSSSMDNDLWGVLCVAMEDLDAALAAAPASPAGLDVERLTRALVDISTRDEPLEPDERIVAVALEPDAPENMAALIADAYRAAEASRG